jgi:ubiquinone/menaquinone biosynthesis C-methylase UbiE
VVDELCRLYPTATFEDLILARLSARFKHSDLTIDERRDHFTNYGLSLQTRGQRFHRMFQDKLAQHLSAPSCGLALDIGCGTGAGLVALAADFEQVVGLDISMSALITANKLVESNNLTNVTLIRTTALNLPFPEGVFDYVIAINVLEHVFEPTKMLQEVHRVLAPGGVFGGDSRNRFDLFFREPHAGLRWVGFLPRRWMAPYVRWRKGISYHQTHLLSFGNLKAALQSSFRHEWHIVLPEVSAYGASTRSQHLVNQASRFSLLRATLTRLSPTFLALARRTDPIGV